LLQLLPVVVFVVAKPEKILKVLDPLLFVLFIFAAAFSYPIVIFDDTRLMFVAQHCSLPDCIVSCQNVFFQKLNPSSFPLLSFSFVASFTDSALFRTNSHQSHPNILCNFAELSYLRRNVVTQIWHWAF